MREISKRDIWSPARVAQERPDIDYKLIAIDFLPVQVRTECNCVSPLATFSASFEGPAVPCHRGMNVCIKNKL